MYFGSRLLLFEVSTVFLNMHWFLEKSHIRGPVYFCNGITLVASFFIFRIVWGLYMTTQIFIVSLARINEIHFMSLIFYGGVGVFLNFLNIYWFVKMISMLMRKLKSG